MSARTSMTPSEFYAFAAEHVPLIASLGLTVEAVGDGEVSVRAPYRAEFGRPGGTVSGPVMMAAADFAMYAAVISRIGLESMAVTTSLNMNFLSRPPPADVIATARLLKLGTRLAVGEVSVYSIDGDTLVAHATCTYSIPPRR
ncbi:MAG: PaaI family thioesterase [Gammaproteobacteria bacterium]